MQEFSKYLVNNGEDEMWLKQLVLAYFSMKPDLWVSHTEAMVIANEVSYGGHVWRAIPYSSPTTFPRLELKSDTTTTRVAVPIEVAVTIIAVLKKMWEPNLWTQRSKLIGLCNASVKDQLCLN